MVDEPTDPAFAREREAKDWNPYVDDRRTFLDDVLADNAAHRSNDRGGIVERNSRARGRARRLLRRPGCRGERSRTRSWRSRMVTSEVVEDPRDALTQHFQDYGGESAAQLATQLVEQGWMDTAEANESLRVLFEAQTLREQLEAEARRRSSSSASSDNRWRSSRRSGRPRSWRR